MASRVLTEGQKRLLLESVHSIGLPVRTANHLEGIEVFTVADLLAKAPEDLLAIPNFGDKTLREVYNRLHEQGLTCVGYEPDVPKTDQAVLLRPSFKLPAPYDPKPSQFRKGRPKKRG